MRSMPFAFQCSMASRDVEQVDAADHLVDACGSRARAMISRSSSAMKNMIVDDVLGLARELLAQLRVLRGDADRAGVEVADAHHDAADRDERRGARSRTPRRRAARRSRRRGRS